MPSRLNPAAPRFLNTFKITRFAKITPITDHPSYQRALSSTLKSPLSPTTCQALNTLFPARRHTS